MTKQQHERKARFKEVIKFLNIDRQILAINLGYKKKYLDQILSAEKNLSDTIALKFTKRYKQVNEDWLMHGTGEMLNPEINHTYDPGGGVPRTLSDLEQAYKADPLAGLRDIISRLEELERWKAELEGKKE